MPRKTILLATDHAGFELKEKLKSALRKQGHEVHDLSPTTTPSDDYPPIAAEFIKELQGNNHIEGILLCGSGHGMAIAANRHKGVRAILARTPQDAEQGRIEDLGNVLVLGGRITSLAKANAIIKTWLGTKIGTTKRYRERAQQMDV